MKEGIEFYSGDTISLAKRLLGKVLVRVDGEKVYRGIIVEIEAYLGLQDKACHTYGGKMTERTKTMYFRQGFSYVYLIYGIYSCFNITSAGEGIPEGVLVRAIEPISDIDDIAINRYGTSYNQLNKYKRKNISNGPGKLCKALKIDRDLNEIDLLGDTIYIEDIGYNEFSIVESKRIGIDYAEEAREYLYRFYIDGNEYVSNI